MDTANTCPVFGGPGKRTEVAQPLFHRDFPVFIQRPEVHRQPMMFVSEGQDIMAMPQSSYSIYQWRFTRSDAIPSGFYAYQGDKNTRLSSGNDAFPYGNMPVFKRKRKRK